MQPRIRSPHVFMPASLTDALLLKMLHPRALLYAGGTFILPMGTGKTGTLPDEVISLRNVEELQRITRTERFLEIGSMVTLNNLLQTGRKVLPRMLTTAISRLGNPAVRNLATIGGNLSVPDRRLSLYPVLHVLDARLELRHHEKTRWVPIGRFIRPDGRPDFEQIEIMVRIRIPLSQWNIQVYSAPGLSSLEDGSPATFCGLAAIQRDLVSDFRFILGFPGSYCLRSRELEAEIVGRKLPLSGRLVESFMEDFREIIAEHETELSPFQREQAEVAVKRFLVSFPQI